MNLLAFKTPACQKQFAETPQMLQAIIWAFALSVLGVSITTEGSALLAK